MLMYKIPMLLFRDNNFHIEILEKHNHVCICIELTLNLKDSNRT